MDPRSPLVLVVDDDPDVRESLEHVLVAEGFRVRTAADGQHALETVGDGEVPCAILLDWLMPRVDGQSFLRRRAASPSLARVPVFVISATHAPVGDPRIQGFLQKPFAITALVALLGNLCGTHCPPERNLACRGLAAGAP